VKWEVEILLRRVKVDVVMTMKPSPNHCGVLPKYFMLSVHESIFIFLHHQERPSRYREYWKFIEECHLLGCYPMWLL
jgi:hypothetical protein